MSFDPAELTETARGLLGEAVALRRELHRYPELGNQLPRTQQAVLDRLADLPVEVSTGTTVTSVVADLVGSAEGPTVLLRGDMDALPMPEESGEDFASEVGEAMHACGHDAHTAMLLGAARLLSDRRADLAGRVRFMFQPGEEGHHGAAFMLEEGVADGVDRAFAIHGTPNLPSGWLMTRGGPLLASSDTFAVTVRGRGGHASMPHLANDPIPVACEIVSAIQTWVTRRVDVFRPGVVTVSSIRAGTTTNVIPEVAVLEGTVRAVARRTRSDIHAALERLGSNIARAHDMTAEVEVFPGYPVTVNDQAQADWVLDVARRLREGDGVITAPSPIMGAEDFSYVLEQVPGAMAFLGLCPEGADPSQAPGNHSNRMRIEESAMATGIALHAAVALDALG